MSTAPFIDSEGKRSGEVELTGELFDVQVNVPIMHEVVRAQLAAARAGTHSTKTRGEVRGGGRKPWRQKGTGRSRHGSIREPSWVGGGVAHGPKPRDYGMRINRKERALALRSALTDRAREGKVIVVDVPTFDEPSTKRAVEILKSWGADGKTLFVIGKDQEEENINAWKSFRNLPLVLIVTYPTAYTVLAAETVVFTKAALESLAPKAAEPAAKTPEPPKAAEPKAPEPAKADEPVTPEPTKAAEAKADEPKADERRADEPEVVEASAPAEPEAVTGEEA